MRVNTKTTLITGLILALLACLGHAGAVARAPRCSTASSGEAATSRPTTPGLERDADRILREMSAYLTAAMAFTFHADVTYDAVVDDSQMVRY